ncbi:putative enoyl-hydratase isomerase family protein [Venustampulla echinocandica]|uniref:Putative enoyl-hydratase isomerase family protein n=1 Tax=Venustampulla echinocandica TaxID=2656787 RepID=A0A370TEM5_9HELO|nr:putative enoyl-hydratase isomerase family protein [Venustampulla echinocandica]RDL33148.1 putative enoyl-hydratase isomerase family protein [Venustampulla echinocandica]
MPSLPESYSSLPLQHIRISHVPATSPTPTPVILITLYRPGKHNAFTETMAIELETAFTTLSLDPRVKTIVVTGHGRIFCAGADLEASSDLSSSSPSSPSSTADINNARRNHRDTGGRVTLAIHRCSKPVIAAINGSAVGVGITMTLPMSIRVVSSSAKIGFVFARRGIVMEAASSYFLPRLIGLSRAMHLVTTGSVYPSTSPLLSSLFSEVVAQGSVLDRALEIAADVAANTSTVSTALMLDLMWRGPGSAEEAHLLDSKVLKEVFEGADKKEGVESFLEKRDPRFEGDMGRDAPSVWPWWGAVDVRNKEGEGRSKL